MSSLLQRVVSAVVVLLCVCAAFFFFGAKGLFVLGAILALLCIYEFAQINFFPTSGRFRGIYLLFVFLNGLVLLVSSVGYELQLHFLAGACCVFITCGLWVLRGACDNETLYRLINRGLLGFLYVGVFPSLALRLLVAPKGLDWFWFLVVTVVVGDIVAYFLGSKFGKTKIMPAVSPNKSVEGAVGALIGAAIVGLIFSWTLLMSVPPALVMITAVVTSFGAQSGDFFESLMKRVANKKDSGVLLPGHGGFLDRLDGVLFGAPIVYIAYVYYFETLLT